MYECEFQLYAQTRIQLRLFVPSRLYKNSWSRKVYDIVTCAPRNSLNDKSWRFFFFNTSLTLKELEGNKY